MSKEKHDKTPLELEIELKLSQIELNKLNSELNNLKDIKQKLKHVNIVNNEKNDATKAEIVTKAENLFLKSEKKISKLTQRVDQSYLFK